MKKISIRGSVFNVLQFLYYSVCLCGLVWQVVEISNNFFQHGVVSDIKIFMPHTIKEDKNLHICFDRRELMNMTVYEQLWNKYHSSVPLSLASDSQRFLFSTYNLTLDEIFRLSLEPYEVFLHLQHGARSYKIKYIHDSKICYEFRNRLLFLFFKSDSVHKSNVSKVWLLLDDTMPKACRTNKHKKYYVTHGKEMAIRMCDNYYDMIKLPSPYPDDCFDYTSIGYVDQDNAIGMCELEYAMTKKFIISYGYCYKESEAKYLPYRMGTLYGQSCSGRYKRVDCRKKYYRMISSSAVLADHNIILVSFSIQIGSDPSFRIESKPRIDNIDYITYICGALGTWFGICALNFNPFPIFFKPNEPIGDNTNAVDHFLVTPSRVKKLEDRLAILSASFQLQLAATSRQVKELSRDVERLNTKDELVMSEIE